MRHSSRRYNAACTMTWWQSNESREEFEFFDCVIWELQFCLSSLSMHRRLFALPATDQPSIFSDDWSIHSSVSEAVRRPYLTSSKCSRTGLDISSSVRLFNSLYLLRSAKKCSTHTFCRSREEKKAQFVRLETPRINICEKSGKWEIHE